MTTRERRLGTDIQDLPDSTECEERKDISYRGQYLIGMRFLAEIEKKEQRKEKRGIAV